MLRIAARSLSLALFVLVASCAAHEAPPTASPRLANAPFITCGPSPYACAMAELREHDAVGSWDEEACSVTRALFEKADEAQERRLPVYAYNAAVADERCGLRADAEKHFRAALTRDPKFHQARAALALMTFEDSRGVAIDDTISELSGAVFDSQYRNTVALVGLARLQMQRNASTANSDGMNDFERAKKNLQRALAVDDGNTSAMNGLALFYLETARMRANATAEATTRTGARKIGDTQALDLALVVASQAIAKRPDSAPIHNTAGLIYAALGDLSTAVRSFDRARKLAPNFYEAHMNYAAVNMEFRGFANSESAYGDAVRLRPDDYDAHLGLALALRGEIDDANFDAKLAAASRELASAKKIDPARPEAYFNQAILIQEYAAKYDGPGAVGALQNAKVLFGEFAEKARGKSQFAETMAEVIAVSSKPDAECMGPLAKRDHACLRGRIQNIDDTIRFMSDTFPRSSETLPTMDE